MSNTQSCFLCKFCVLLPPASWEPRYEDASYDRHDFAKAVRDGKPLGELQCALNPVWIKVRSDHHCGQWRSGIGGETLSEFIWGSWEGREVDRLRDEVKQLKASLVVARKRSASRLARLSKSRQARCVDEKAAPT